MSPTSDLLAALLFGSLLIPGFTSAQDVEETAGTRAEIMAVVDESLERVSAEDLVGFTDLMLEGAVITAVGISPRSGEAFVRTRTRADERADSIPGDVVERGFDPEIMVSGAVAVVWLPYDFYVEGAWSHCGVDVFTLVRVETGWRVASLAYSVQQPPECRPHPDGPPQGHL